MFKPPSSFVQSFDSCVPLKWPAPDDDGNNNNNAPKNFDSSSEGLNWDPLAFVILALVGLVIVLVVTKIVLDYFHRKREEEARERLLRARGNFSGATPQANISNLLLSSTGNSSNDDSGMKAKNTTKRRQTDNNNNIAAAAMAQDVHELEARAEERDRARRLLSRLPTAALATRPMETCRQMAALILSAAFKTKPTPKAMSELSLTNTNSSRCSICLDSLDVTPTESGGGSGGAKGDADVLSKSPSQIMLPQCGHKFHTMCLHKQLIFKAQKIDENNNIHQHQNHNNEHNSSSHKNNNHTLTFLFAPTCAVCGCEIVSDPKVLEQAESVALGRRLVVNSNPLL